MGSVPSFAPDGVDSAPVQFPWPNGYRRRRRERVRGRRAEPETRRAQARAAARPARQVDDMFWASKMHFHLTNPQFYNFPYTFGYLFALGVYAQQAGARTPHRPRRCLAPSPALSPSGLDPSESLPLPHTSSSSESLPRPRFQGSCSRPPPSDVRVRTGGQGLSRPWGARLDRVLPTCVCGCARGLLDVRRRPRARRSTRRTWRCCGTRAG